MNAADLSAILARRSGSNFYYSFLFLPRRKRQAIYALYAFCRTVDDAVDQGRRRRASSAASWRSGGSSWRVPTRAIRPSRSPSTSPRWSGPSRSSASTSRRSSTASRWTSRSGATPRSRSSTSTATASRRRSGWPASRSSATRDARARDYAVNLGVALQLTNILRDLRTDAERGRIYLPLDEIRRFGYSEDELLHGRHTPAFLALMRFQADRAHAYYRAARSARPPADRRRLVAAEIMGRIYHALLREIEARQFRVFDSRIRVSNSEEDRARARRLPARPARLMRAAVHAGAGEIRLETRPAPAIGPGELLLRVRGCGLCGSDLAKLRGPAPRPAVLGHEVVGEVAAGRRRGSDVPAGRARGRGPPRARARPVTTAGEAAPRCAGPSGRRTSIRADSPSTCASRPRTSAT